MNMIMNMYQAKTTCIIKRIQAFSWFLEFTHRKHWKTLTSSVGEKDEQVDS